MPDDVRVCCIGRADRRDPRSPIRYIGGVGAGGFRWKLSEESAIAGIESGRWRFFVDAGGGVARVVVASSRDGRKYLRTAAGGGGAAAGLRDLPECPA